jgi:hypothetical protein
VNGSGSLFSVDQAALDSFAQNSKPKTQKLNPRETLYFIPKPAHFCRFIRSDLHRRYFADSRG